MNIEIIRSDKIYKRIATAENNIERENIFRNELMKPFEFKWKCINIPLKAEGRIDVVSYTKSCGLYHPDDIKEDKIETIEKINNDAFWTSCVQSIKDTLKGFEDNKISLPVQNYKFTVLLSDPQNPMTDMTGDYCGDGGIPGYIMGTIVPNDKSINMLKVALAHETNHNVRWQFKKWGKNITLADMIVSEGLAENHAALMFGEDKIGMWVSKTSEADLKNIINPIIKRNLNQSDFYKLSSYLYGDEIMTMRGAQPIGMPYCGGYACGYALIKYYLEKTGKNIYEATIEDTAEIISKTKEFWN